MEEKEEDVPMEVEIIGWIVDVLLLGSVLQEQPFKYIRRILRSCQDLCSILIR